MEFSKSDLDTPVNESETLREFVKNSEDYFGMGNLDVDNLSDRELNGHVEFLDYLWTK